MIAQGSGMLREDRNHRLNHQAIARRYVQWKKDERTLFNSAYSRLEARGGFRVFDLRVRARSRCQRDDLC